MEPFFAGDDMADVTLPRSAGIHSSDARDPSLQQAPDKRTGT